MHKYLQRVPSGWIDSFPSLFLITDFILKSILFDVNIAIPSVLVAVCMEYNFLSLNFCFVIPVFQSPVSVLCTGGVRGSWLRVIAPCVTVLWNP